MAKYIMQVSAGCALADELSTSRWWTVFHDTGLAVDAVGGHAGYMSLLTFPASYTA
jgi:hypothetical protein